MFSDEDGDEEFDRVTYDHGFAESLRSLHKGKQLTVASRLDTLRDKEQLPDTGANAINLGNGNSSTSLKKLEPFCSEDEVGMQGFQDEEPEFIHSYPKKDQDLNSSEELISDEDDVSHPKSSFFSGVVKSKKNYLNSGHENLDDACTWSAVIEESSKLVCLRERTGRSSSLGANSEIRRNRKADRHKVNPKFSFRSQLHKEEMYWPHLVKDEREEQSEDNVGPSGRDLQPRFAERSMVELLGGLQHGGPGNSVSALLEDLQEKNSPLKQPFKMLLWNKKTKDRKMQVAGRRTSTALANRLLDNEDAPEFMVDRMSSEDEDNDQNLLTLATEKVKEQTMTDLFQEAFSAAVVDADGIPSTSRKAGFGYYGRLQQVIQRDKDRHLDFLKQLQTGPSPHDESRCMNVQILSRFLDAKLTVCHCLFGDERKNPHGGNSNQKSMESGETTEKTVIFSSKICGNVDLEVGNLIRVHPPWKEVQVREDERIILCTYFSQIVG